MVRRRWPRWSSNDVCGPCEAVFVLAVDLRMVKGATYDQHCRHVGPWRSLECAMVILECGRTLASTLGVSYAPSTLIPPGPVILIRSPSGKEWGVWRLEPPLQREAEEIDRIARKLTSSNQVQRRRRA
jgi:hypothetical protein